MHYLLGIDLGTSSVKCLLTDTGGTKICDTNVEYDIIAPGEGYAEQDPNRWWESTAACIAALLKKSAVPAKNIRAVGLSGQMHGTVVLDSENASITNAIIHCDARSGSELQQIFSVVDKAHYSSIVYNPLYTGFQPAGLLWLRNHRPEEFSRIRKVILPKDYIRLQLTGELGTEITDASGTTLVDMEKSDWSIELLDALELEHSWFLPISKSYEVAGEISAAAADRTGLCKGTPVVFGGGDQAMQALGNGAIRPGMVTSNIGTSGQIFTPTDSPVLNPAMNTHTFRHAPDNTWYIMGACLSSGLCLKWLTQKIIGRGGYRELDEQAAKLAPCSGPIFAPYLMGERTPHLDPKARGVLFGLSLEHDYRHIYRSVLEGVIFSLNDCLRILEGLGIRADTVIASGGGAKSGLWMQMQADIYNREITTTASCEQANLGAVILAAVGCGLYDTVEHACTDMVKPGTKRAYPNRENVLLYEEEYQKYRELYPRLKTLYE